MMTKKLLLTFAATAILTPTVRAQGWVGDIVENDKDYYLYNVGTGFYLHHGDDWSTYAVLNTPGFVFTTDGSDGSYILRTKKNSYVGLNFSNASLGSNGYVDSSENTSWTFTNVGTDADPVYTIKTGDNYLYYNPNIISGNTTVNNTNLVVTIDGNADATSDYAKWKIITVEHRNDVSAATPTNPIDVSWRIINANFVANYGKNRGVDYAWPNVHAQSNGVAETWHSAADVYQEIELPNGVYTFTAQGFSDRESPSTFLYANKNQETIQSAYGDVPSGLSGASESFLAGKFKDNSVSVAVTDGKLRIGINTTAYNEWVVFDNFGLSYSGKDFNYVAENNLIDAVTTDASTVKDKRMNATVLSTLNAKIDAASSVNTYDDYCALNNALMDAKASALEYDSIVDYNTEITALAEKLDTDGKAYYDSNISNISTKLTNNEYTTFQEFKSEIYSLYLQAVKSQTTEGSDWSGLINNAHFTTSSLEGWTFEDNVKPKTLNTTTHNCEFYNQKFDMSQTLTGLKEGTYEISLQAFQRPGAAADVMSPYKEGTWTSSVVLYTTAAQADVKNICEHAQTTKVNDDDSYVTYNDTTYYIPNSMAGAKVWFEKTTEDGTPFYTTTIKATVLEDGTLTFGFKGDVVGDTKWLIFDNFKLTYLSSTAKVDAEESQKLIDQVPTTPYYKEVKAQIDACVEKLENDMTNATYYNDLRLILPQATESAEAYSTAKSHIEEVEAYISKTNVYTAEAYKTFSDDLATFRTNYEAGNLTNEEVVTFRGKVFSTGYKGDNTLDDLLLSAWGVPGGYTGSVPYLDTWASQEDADIIAPFLEYWTGDASKLDEKTLTATLENLTPNTLYDVSVLTRVHRMNNNTDTPYGITLQVGLGAPVDVCAGEALSTNGFADTFTATGRTDESGVLTISYLVKSDNNISWLAFRDMYYAPYTPKTETRKVNTDLFGTVCLPFAFTPEGATLYSVSEVTSSVVKLQTVSGATTPGEAYIYQATADTQTFTPSEETTYVNAPVEGILTGVFDVTSAPEGSYVLQRKNGGDQKFYHVVEGKLPTINPYRAYLVKPTVNESALRLSFGEDVTGIDAVEALTAGKAAIYDVNGRKLDKLRKGINIVNGIKVIVK